MECQKNSRISNGNIMVTYNQKFPNRGGSDKIKNFPSKGGGRGSQKLGTVPQFYLVIIYDGSPPPLYSRYMIHNRPICQSLLNFQANSFSNMITIWKWNFFPRYTSTMDTEMD